MSSKDKIVWLILCVGLFLAVFSCAPTHQQSAGAIATTQPASHPLNNINQVLYHSQKALEGINILAFIVCLGAIGVVFYGGITADKPIETLGLWVAAIAGSIALGTLVGELSLPFAPWIILALFVAGVGYASYLIYEKHVTSKPAAVEKTPLTNPPA